MTDRGDPMESRADFASPQDFVRFCTNAMRKPELAFTVDPGVIDEVMSRNEALLTSQTGQWSPPTPQDLHLLGGKTQFWPTFVVWRAWERLGRVSLPHDNDYVLALVGLGSLSGREVLIARLLMKDPDLMKTVFWKIFEVEGSEEVSLTRGEASWTPVLRGLVEARAIPRERVMKSCLQSLNRGFAADRVGALPRIYDSFDPTIAELARDQRLFAILLASGVAPTASWAIRAIEKVQRAGLLDQRSYLTLAGNAMAGATVTVQRVIGLAQEIVEENPSLIDEAARAVGAALKHPDENAQRKAVEALLSWKRSDIILPHFSALSPSVHARILIDPRVSSLAPPTDAASAYPSHPLYELDAAEAAWLLPQALEGEADPLDVERVLGYIAYAGIDDKVALSLYKRARVIIRSRAEPISWAMATLVLAWLEESTPDGGIGPDQVRENLDVVWPINHLVAEAVERALDRRARTTLWSTPTDTRGGIEPRILVDRALANTEPSQADLGAALLRLTSHAREEELHRAKEVPGELGMILRYALGGPLEAETLAEVRANPVPWAIAASVRDPLVEDPLILDADLASHLPYAMTVREDVHRWSNVLRDAQWEALVWPGNPEPFASRLREPLAGHIAWEEVDHRLAPAIAGLRRVPGPLGSYSASCLCLALGAKNLAVRTEGVSLFAEAVPHRLGLEELVTAMIITRPAIHISRWALSLGEAASVTGTTAEMVRLVLTGLLPSIPPNQRRVSDLIRLLASESVRVNQPVTDPGLKAWLETFTGSSLAAKSARQLLGIR